MAGCSSTTFFYNRLDTVIGWYADDYITLNAAQEASFDAQIDALLDWHRQEELPRYVRLLEAAELALDDELTVAELRQLFDRASMATERLQDRVVATLVNFGAEITLEQRQEFIAKLVERQEELREEFLERSDEEFYEDANDRLVSNLTDYLGRLTPEQKGLIAQEVERFVRLDALWLADRERWLGALDSIIASESPDWTARVQAEMKARANQRLPEYLAGFEHNTQVTLELLCVVLNQRTPKQDGKLRRFIANYQADFRELIAQSEGAQSGALSITGPNTDPATKTETSPATTGL